MSWSGKQNVYANVEKKYTKQSRQQGRAAYDKNTTNHFYLNSNSFVSLDFHECENVVWVYDSVKRLSSQNDKEKNGMFAFFKDKNEKLDWHFIDKTGAPFRSIFIVEPETKYYVK